MKAATLLKKAAALLINKGWTRGAFAQDKNGNRVNARAKTAACYCAVGAMRAVVKQDGTPEYWRAREALAGNLGYNVDIFETNDTHATSADDMVTFLLLTAESMKE